MKPDRKRLKFHWPEYLMEMGLVGLLITVIALVAVAFEYPGSLIRQRIGLVALRRSIRGMAIGVTLLLLIRSPWGQQSGAHLNPGITLSYFRLGKVKGLDAGFYVLAQTLGGILGIFFAALLLRSALAHPDVRYAATVPGSGGQIGAWIGEFLISFVLMGTILSVSNHARLAKFTPLFVAVLITAFVVVEAPLSGASLNPARSLASAIPSNLWHGFWVYLTAPPVGMLAATELYRRLQGLDRVYCAKLNHQTSKRCIFHCRIHEIKPEWTPPATTRSIGS